MDTSDPSIAIRDSLRSELLGRYGRRDQGQIRAAQQIDYGTVRDFCDSCDNIPYLSHLQGDLKDLQRPSALKQILALCDPGAALLEIGAGSPHVAHVLTQLGYRVTVVDPYDGSAGGPAIFDQVKSNYPGLKIVRDHFNDRVEGFTAGHFDCIYSISVLEHIPDLGKVFRGIKRFLKQGGYSLHLIDHVLAGLTADFHLEHLQEIVALQANLAGQPVELELRGLSEILTTMAADVDTYYLSAEGHNLWRGQTPYEQFPFRKVVSVHTTALCLP